MPLFDCQIGSPSGKIVAETFEAASAEALRQRLRNEGYQIIALHRRLTLFSRKDRTNSGRIASHQFLAFNQELLVLLRAGLPILQVLDATLEELESGPLRQAVEQIREGVKGGEHLSQAFGRFPRLFPHLYIASLQAGEQTGDLPLTIGRYIDYQKRVEQIKSKMKTAAFYPALLCLAAFGVLLFMIMYVVPQFAEIYSDSHVTLPWVTRMLMALADFLKDHFLWLLAALVVMSLLLLRMEMNSHFRLLIDRWKLKLGLLGPLFLEYALLNFCRTLATLLGSGIPLLSAMKMSCKTLNNRYLEKLLSQATVLIAEGQSPAKALEEAEFFPTLALRMVMAGERSGALQEMLFEVAVYYEAQVEERLARLSSMIEPLMMLIIGLLIGGIVVAMYIPIFQLAGAA